MLLQNDESNLDGKISNVSVLGIVGTERGLLVAVRRRQLWLVGDVWRKGGLGKLVPEGKISGK